MPVITLHGCDMTRQVQFIDITCRVQLSDTCNYREQRIKILERALSHILMEYYDAMDSEIFTDEAFEEKINNQPCQ